MDDDDGRTMPKHTLVTKREHGSHPFFDAQTTAPGKLFRGGTELAVLLPIVREAKITSFQRDAVHVSDERAESRHVEQDEGGIPGSRLDDAVIFHGELLGCVDVGNDCL